MSLGKYWWSGDRNTDDQLAADTLANSPRLSSLPPPPFYSWNTARSDNNCTGQTAASPGHRCTLARCRGSIRCWPGGSEQGGWWWTHRWTGEERGGRLARDWLPARPIPGPALLACSNTACHGADPPKLGRQQQLCRRWLFPLSMSTKMASSGLNCSDFFGHCVTWLPCSHVNLCPIWIMNICTYMLTIALSRAKVLNTSLQNRYQPDLLHFLFNHRSQYLSRQNASFRMNHTNKSIRSVTNLAKCVITDQSCGLSYNNIWCLMYLFLEINN